MTLAEKNLHLKFIIRNFFYNTEVQNVMFTIRN